MTRRRLAAIATTLVLVLGLCYQASAAEVYDVDPVHSMIVFRVRHLQFSYSYGRFNDISGSFTIDEESPGNSSVELVVKADSVDTHYAERDQHLRSPDFLNAKQFPVIRFKSTKVKKTGDSTYEVRGDLSLHGVTKPLTLTLERVGTGKDPWGGYRTGFSGEITIKRSDFGMNFMPQGVGDEIQLLLTVEGKRK